MRIRGADHIASLAQLRESRRWPRRRARFPGRGRIAELAADPVAWLRRGRPSRLRGLGRIGDDERLIGMLMIRDEDDVLAESMALAVRWFDRIYVLDGTTDADRRATTDAILATFPEVKWHARDEDHFPEGVTDGARQILLQRIREEQGVDHWIGLLHADEFLDQDPRPMLNARHPVWNPSLRVRVAHAFLHVDDEAAWDDEAPLRERVGHVMWPGVPESRFFFDDGSRDFDPALHSKVLPKSHRPGELVDGYVITQYNERDPKQVVDRARSRQSTGWQVEHYARLLTDQPEVFIETLDRPEAPFAPEFAGDPEGPFRPEATAAIPRVDRGSPALDDELKRLVEAPDPVGIREWTAAASEPGAFGRDDPLRGTAALLRHLAAVLRSRRSSRQQREAVAVETTRMLSRPTDS